VILPNGQYPAESLGFRWGDDALRGGHHPPASPLFYPQSRPAGLAWCRAAAGSDQHQVLAPACEGTMIHDQGCRDRQRVVGGNLRPDQARDRRQCHLAPDRRRSSCLTNRRPDRAGKLPWTIRTNGGCGYIPPSDLPVVAGRVGEVEPPDRRRTFGRDGRGYRFEMASRGMRGMGVGLWPNGGRFYCEFD
jgi:hypothetical protein